MNPDREHLERLLEAYFDGSLDEDSRHDLEQLVTSSASARARFWERAGMEDSLERWASKSRGETMALPAPAPRKVKLRRSHVAAISGWAAAAALVAAWGLQSWFAPGGGGKGTTAGTPAERPIAPLAGMGENTPVAYLSRVSRLSGENRMLAGQSLAAGREVEIGEGLIEVDFFSGARVAIQGPARFKPESDMRLTVSQGTVQVDVPDSAKGFVLVLPDGTVTDFGTSFGVVVNEDRTSRLQVSRGEIELAGTKDGGSARRIKEGQAYSLAESGISRPIDFRPMGVSTSLEERAREDMKDRQFRWDEVCREIAADPSVLVHFRFLPDEEGSREILNRATGPNAPRTGTVIAAEWSHGRWDGKPALAFHGPSDRVRVDIPGAYPQATFLAWVRVDNLPRRYNGLFLSEYGIEGEAHWQMSSQGSFWFGVRPKEKRGTVFFHRAFSEPVLSPADFGTWRMLATTYDAPSRTVIHYVDAVEVSRTVLGDSVPIRFGRATLGNFFDPLPEEHADAPGLGEEWSFRNWSGAIDEFLLYSRTLEAGEIQQLHEAGRAN
jgi:hypothetical protein